MKIEECTNFQDSRDAFSWQMGTTVICSLAQRGDRDADFCNESYLFGETLIRIPSYIDMRMKPTVL